MLLYLIKIHAIKAHGDVEEQLHSFLTSAVDNDEYSASYPTGFSLRECATVTPEQQ